MGLDRTVVGAAGAQLCYQLAGTLQYLTSGMFLPWAQIQNQDRNPFVRGAAVSRAAPHERPHGSARERPTAGRGTCAVATKPGGWSIMLDMTMEPSRTGRPERRATTRS